MSEILSSAIIIGSLLFVVIVGYCCLSMAREWDNISEQAWEEYCKSEGVENGESKTDEQQEV